MARAWRSLRYGKGYPADDSVSRVPLIIAAPRGKQGQTHEDIVEAVDIVPTLLELAGVQIPPFMQGESLAGIVEGKGNGRNRVALTEGAGWKCLRTALFRYLIHDDGREALWDLLIDPGEYEDVSASREYADGLAECRRLLLKRLLEIERPLPRTWTY